MKTPKKQPIKKSASKNELIEKHLLVKRKITSWDAITLYQVTRLSAVIFNLRKRGWKISSSQVTKKVFGSLSPITMAEYKLLENPKPKSNDKI